MSADIREVSMYQGTNKTKIVNIGSSCSEIVNLYLPSLHYHISPEAKNFDVTHLDSLTV